MGSLTGLLYYENAACFVESRETLVLKIGTKQRLGTETGQA